MQIGPYQLDNNLVLAPMAGVSDRPFRSLCRDFGAGLTVSEMISANPALRKHRKTLLKVDHGDEAGIRSIQILGNDPRLMAETARFAVEQGGHIIDINMGCPAKKVCSSAAGSALLKDESLVERILDAVVNAVDVPVTLKIRTGWDKENRNAVRIAEIAERAGIAAITVHGRTRACKFDGQAEHETTKAVKQTVNIPVIANGDIQTAEQARQVLAFTKADGIMIGRAALGTPWIFRQINYFLHDGRILALPSKTDIHHTVSNHLYKLYQFYGDMVGVRMARKHIAWYLRHFDSVSESSKSTINQVQTPTQQLELVDLLFTHIR